MIYLVDPLYNPNLLKEITSGVYLQRGIPLAKFLGARGTRSQLQQISVDHKQLVRNLYLHAELLRSAQRNTDLQNVRVTVAEGVYVPAINESPTGVNEKKVDGRAVVYQVINRKGKTDIPKSFDLAVYWKDYADYDRISLDYDTYDPNGDLVANIVVEMPNVSESFDVNFSKQIDTYYNGALQSSNELLEILK